MTSTTDGILPPEDERRVRPIDLNGEIQASYLEYAMSVIVGRALPDVRDGLKPVVRRLLYAMYDGGYRPDRGYSKCSRVVGEVMGQYHPHGDLALYDTLARLTQSWVMRYPLVSGQGNFGSPDGDSPAAMRYTECRMAPLALEMVRDINRDTVEFEPNYDGRTTQPVILPARFPNLLVNGSAGIAVGMATNIPPHNLGEVVSGVQWALAHPEATRPELLAALMERIKGPDFPAHGLIVGHQGIEDTYRTGRGSVIMRGVVDIDEDKQGRTNLVITQLPYMVRPAAVVRTIAELVDGGKIAGITDLKNFSSGKTGLRIVVTLRRDAQPRVVLNNLYKHTALQQTFGCNMLALVDDVPRTLSLDQFVTHWITHQIEVVYRRTAFLLREAEKEAHLYRGLAKALDAIDEVIALIRASQTPDEARSRLMDLLEIDQEQADYILVMQLRRLAAMERQRILGRLTELETEIGDYTDILARPERQRQIVSDELAEIGERYADPRRTQIVHGEGDTSMADLIPDSDVVVTITRGGYAKRTPADQFRLQRRGGRGVRGANLREADVVDQLFTTTNHHWILFFTTAGRVYRTKVWDLPEAARDSRGQHVAGLLSFQPGEQIAQVLTLRDYEQSPYLVLATKAGLVKKTRLTDYDSPRQAGVIAVQFRTEGDALIGAALVSENDDLLLVTRNAQAIRFKADDEQLRPMGRSTSGVTGMKFRGDDELLSMAVVPEEGSEAEQAADAYVFTVTDGGFAKRTRVSEYRRQGRGGLGIKAMRVAEQRGSLVGALVVSAGDEVLAIKTSGQVTRSAVADVPVKGRDTMGVIFAGVKGKDSVVAVARNAEAVVDETDAETESPSTDAAEVPASNGAVAPEGDGHDGNAAELPGQPPEEPDGTADTPDGTDAPKE